jgi:hypothetical protein
MLRRGFSDASQKDAAQRNENEDAASTVVANDAPATTVDAVKG